MPTFQHETARHPLGGWALTQLASVDDAGRATRIAFAPEMGCNLLSFTVDGVEYLFDAAVRDGATRLLGTPVLYPTPNRVRDARMTFEGRAFTFPPNNGPNFIHGLVREEPWECDAPVVGSNRISATSRIAFTPGKAYYERFPIRNTLTLTYSVMPGVVRLDFLVANDDPQARLPFGLAIHPYFRIHGTREQVRLLVPAQRWMEATNLLPTGRLVPMEQGPADLRQPTPLSTLNLDDVFWGLRPEAPQVIHYDALGKKVTLTADAFFTHCVVYTPPPMPFFCVENQSCSTDAHNLFAQGLQEAARLAILEPGQTLRTWIEIAVSAA